MIMSKINGFSVTPVRASPIIIGTSIKLISSPNALAGPTIIRTAPEIIAVIFKQ